MTAVMPLQASSATATNGQVISVPGDAEYDRNEDFNQQIDETYGEINLEGQPFRPSWILFNMARSVYESAVVQAKFDLIEEFKEKLLHKFPSPIAQAFDRYENRAPTAKDRLEHLRNTWEAMIWLLHALTVAEARLHRLALKDAKIPREKSGEEAVTYKALISNQLATRLDVVKAIMELARRCSVSLAIATLVPTSVIDRIRLLNRVRNNLAHRSPVSESQAKRILADCEDEVIDILWELEQLSEVRLIRYISQVGLVVKHEAYVGNGLFPGMKDLTLQAKQKQQIDPCLCEGSMMAVIGDKIFNLRPFVACVELNEGHASRLYIYKTIENGAFQFEDLTTSQFHHDSKVTYQDDINDLRSLFGLSPETA